MIAVQVPDSFNQTAPCLVLGPSSGSRGVYGAIATAGEWGLKHGCAVALVDAGKGVAQLRLLYVEPKARGLGIGKLLVDQIVRFARDKGYKKIRLWTQENLTAARRLYAGAGFALVESAPHRSFGKDWRYPITGKFRS